MVPRQLGRDLLVVLYPECGTQIKKAEIITENVKIVISDCAFL